MNVRSSGYFIASALATCDRCRNRTLVMALAVPPGHEVLVPVEDGRQDSEVWERAAHGALLFLIESLPASLQRHLFTHRDMGSGWANHCEHCDWELRDQDLFCEPGAAFCPESAADARTIGLSQVEEGVEVLAGGYAPEPQFFDAVRPE